MTIDTSQRGSPGWRLKRLMKRLGALRPQYQKLDDYYTGEAACLALTDKVQRQAYRRLMHYSRTNYAELVVEAVRERLKVNAFRTGAAGDVNGDQAAWRIWQANQLDADSALVHRWALTMGDAYMIVGPPDPEIGAPLISVEDPRCVVVEYDAARRRKVVAALKLDRNEELGVDIAYLYLLENGVPWVIRAARKLKDQTPFVSMDGLEWIDEHPILNVDGDPLTRIPVVGFHNRLGARSWGEFEPHLPLLDRINYGVLSRLEIATIQAFRQRAAKGGPDLDEDGNEIDYSDIFAGEPGAIWKLPAGMDLWESGQVDLTPVRNAIKDDVQDLAAVTRTPLFYLTPDAANGSAEGASLAREGLVYKTEDRQVEFGESHEQAESIAFEYEGDAVRASRVDMEVVWAPAERFSLAERYDAASKAGGVLPLRTIREDVLQFSPQEADRMATEDQAQALLTPAPPPALTNA
jgi:hypothetical protein